MVHEIKMYESWDGIPFRTPEEATEHECYVNIKRRIDLLQDEEKVVIWSKRLHRIELIERMIKYLEAKIVVLEKRKTPNEI